MISLFNQNFAFFKPSIILQRSIYRQRNRNGASSDFVKGRACSCPLLSTTSLSLGTSQKLHTFCSISNFTLRLKIQIFRNFFIFCFRGNKRKWKHPFGARQSNFWEGGKTFLSTLFSESYSYIVRGKVLGQKLRSTCIWLQFSESVVFSHTSRRFF